MHALFSMITPRSKWYWMMVLQSTSTIAMVSDRRRPTVWRSSGIVPTQSSWGSLTSEENWRWEISGLYKSTVKPLHHYGHLWEVSWLEEVSLFQRLFCTSLHVCTCSWDNRDSVLILFQRSLIERLHCTCIIRLGLLAVSVKSVAKSSIRMGLNDG